MPKYEIMLIVDPKSTDEAEKLVKDIFKTGVTKFEKLENTQLAYEINKTRTVSYYLAEVDAPGELIKEFVRRANISSKLIWRHMVINIESERAVKSLNAKPRRRFRREYTPRSGETSSYSAPRRESSNE